MPAKKTRAKVRVFVATESGMANVNGKDCPFVKGVTMVAGDDDLYRAASQFFKPVDESLHYSGSVEQMTAAPGELRHADE